MYCVYCVQILRGFPCFMLFICTILSFYVHKYDTYLCIHTHRHTAALQSLSIWSLCLWFGTDPSWHLLLTGAVLLLCCSFFKTKTRREWWGMHGADSRRLSPLTEQTRRQKMATQKGIQILSFFSVLQRGY